MLIFSDKKPTQRMWYPEMWSGHSTVYLIVITNLIVVKNGQNKSEHFTLYSVGASCRSTKTKIKLGQMMVDIK